MSYPIQQSPLLRKPTGEVDASGRLVPLTEADRRRRSESLLAALDDVEAIGPDATDTEEIWAEVFKGIDSSRPDRPLFGESD